jgi:hypothetical protein
VTPPNRWAILGVLFLVRVALGYLFQAAGSVGPPLVRDLGLDWADVGALVGAFLFVLVNKMVADWFTGGAVFFGMSVFIVGWPVGVAALYRSPPSTTAAAGRAPARPPRSSAPCPGSSSSPSLWGDGWPRMSRFPTWSCSAA